MTVFLQRGFDERINILTSSFDRINIKLSSFSNDLWILFKYNCSFRKIALFGMQEFKSQKEFVLSVLYAHETFSFSHCLNSVRMYTRWCACVHGPEWQNTSMRVRSMAIQLHIWILIGCKMTIFIPNFCQTCEKFILNHFNADMFQIFTITYTRKTVLIYSDQNRSNLTNQKISKMLNSLEFILIKITQHFKFWSRLVFDWYQNRSKLYIRLF